MSSSTAGRAGWLVTLAAAVLLPAVLGTPFYLHTATVAVMFIVLALSYDLVVGRIGALSLCQPVFFAWGAYSSALLATKWGNPGLWVELGFAVVGSAVLALAIGIPSFRLSLHSFAIGTMGFGLIAYLVALNWIDVTGGPMCVSGVPPLEVPLGVGSFTVTTGVQSYYVILALAVATVIGVSWLAKSRTGAAFTAVRDDPVLASARGIWPVRMRLIAFTASAALAAIVGAFDAHFQHVVCPTHVDMPLTQLLLIMVFLGGRASLRGVVTAAVVFTVLPQVLRMAESWRLVIFAALLILIVTTIPDGLERLYAKLGQLFSRRSDSTPDAPGPAEETEKVHSG
jgi:ABC-type branched-subunit amino acid transport system permease subunit